MNSILYNKCNNCFINKICIYCRLCDSFLCYNCSSNKKSLHQKHKETFIYLDIDNNSDNITKYKELILSDLSKTMSFFNNHEDKNDLEINQENTQEIISYNDVITKLGEDVQNLVKKANKMKNSMKQYEYKEKVNEDQEKVKEICDNEKKVLKKFDVKEYKSQFQPFFVLNKFEKNMEKYFNNYEVNNDQKIYIKSQIELLFDNVENEVDNIMEDIDKIIGNMNI